MPLSIARAKQSKLKKDLSVKARKLLGYTGNQALPATTQKEIDKIVASSLEARINRSLNNIARQAVAETIVDSKDLVAAVNTTAKLAYETVDSITANQDFKNSLKKAAELQKAKYDAYVAAGFGAEQSFRLLEAEM